MEIYIISHDYDIANRHKINMDVCLILLPSMKQSQDMYGEKKKKNRSKSGPKIHPRLITASAHMLKLVQLQPTVTNLQPTNVRI